MLDALIEHYGQNYVATFEDIRATECRKVNSCNCRGEGECRRVSPEPVVVLWGDSHAEHLLPGLEQIAKQNFRLVPLFTECVPVAGVFEPQNSEQCIARNQQALHAISELKPDVVIIAARWKNVFDSDRFFEKMNSTLHRIKEFSGLTLVIGPVPEWSPDLYKIIAKEYLRKNIAAPLRLKKGVVQTNFSIEGEMLKSLDQRDASYVSLISQLCDDTGCRTQVTDEKDSGLMAWDYGHFTKEGSSLVANTILGPKLAHLGHQAGY